MNLDMYVNEEGLVPSSSLQWDQGQLRLIESGEKVWANPVIRSIADILREREDLWKMAQLRVETYDTMLMRAPIFGVPFDVALRQLLSVRNGRRKESLIKSLFQRIDGEDLEYDRMGVVATMVTHLSRYTGTHGIEIQLEAWQIPNIEAETFYLHGIYTLERDCFYHLDGATIYHHPDLKEQLFREGRKVKGYNKQKYFRIDGHLGIEDVYSLSKAFLPLEDLATEYMRLQEEAADTSQ